MRTKYWLFFAICGLFLSGCGQTEKSDMTSDVVMPGEQQQQEFAKGAANEKVLPGRQQEQGFAKTVTKNLSIGYLLYLPEDYGDNGKKWPLLMFLHGAGERGSNLDKVRKHGPPKIVEAGKDMPFIIVSPQCPGGDWWTEKTEVLINLLDDIEGRYDVDKERVYLTGLSMGGYGTWALASTYPERFAAIVPICGGGKRFSGWRLKDVPVWAFHGAKDNIVPLRESEEMVETVKRSGGEAKLTVYPNASHDSWTETYDNPEVYEWLLGYRNVQK